MKKKVFLFSIFFLINSCVSYSPLIKDEKSNIDFVKPTPIKILGFKTVPWTIGQEKLIDLDQGLRLDFSLPVLKSSHLEELHNKRGVDALFAKIWYTDGKRDMLLGYLEIPLFRKVKSLRDQVSMGLKEKKTEKAYAQINYIASTLVPRTIQFKCPPLHHHFVLGDIKIRDFISKSDTKFVFISNNETEINRKVYPFTFQPQIFRGWHSLVGQYFIELAYYNSLKKRILTNFIRGQNYIDVLTEKEISVNECPKATTPTGGILRKSVPFKWKKKL